MTPSVFVIRKSVLMVGPGVEVLVGGKNMLVLVGTTTTSVFVGNAVAGGFAVGVDGIGVVFTDVGDEAGVLVAKDAPGVRNPSIHAGGVRMDGSRGSK